MTKAPRQRLPFVFISWLAVMFVAALVRQSQGTQITLDGSVYLSFQFLAMVPFVAWTLPTILLNLGASAPLGFLLSGPVFFAYAVVVDLLRGHDRTAPLLIDTAQVLVPIMVAIGLYSTCPSALRRHMGKFLVITVTAIATIYAIVALLVHTLDFGDLVTVRPPGHENMTFVRLSGPLGVSTGLSLILLPALAFCWEKSRSGEGCLWFWRLSAGLNIIYILWTGSRLAPVFLVMLLLFACTSRQVLLLAYLGIIAAIAFDLPDLLIPEKWVRLGISDPGRSAALDTTLAAASSGWDSALLGVGSDRLNVLSQTVSQVARGEIHFEGWNTDFGPFPYGPHSVFLWALGSYGILGAALRCAVFLTPFWKVFTHALAKGFSGLRIPTLMLAVVISAVGFFLDDSHITHPYLTCVWYLFCLLGIDELRRRQASYNPADRMVEPVRSLSRPNFEPAETV